jgi:hypothetical protein
VRSKNELSIVASHFKDVNLVSSLHKDDQSYYQCPQPRAKFQKQTHVMLFSPIFQILLKFKKKCPLSQNLGKGNSCGKV